jgi:F420-non-reducing hydrogenase large subunit
MVRKDKRIVIEPMTRLEGHGKIEIFLDDKGNPKDAFFQSPELRGFEHFCIGRLAEEMPIITERICGVCPEAHHFASTKALDHAFNVEPPVAAKKLRELIYNSYIFSDHALHFFYLGGPDFIVGPGAPKAERNIFGVIDKVGIKRGKEVIKHRAYGQKIIKMIGGRSINPVCGLPGGMSKPLSEEERDEVEDMAISCVDFAKNALELFHDIVLKNEEYVDRIMDKANALNTYYMGLVDKEGKVNFYDGELRVVDPMGKEFTRINPKNVLDIIEEHIETWTYIKFPYLKDVGWNGLVDGADSGIYRVGPLARLNVADGMSTPLANEEYKLFYETLGKKPVHATFAYHWARLVELQYAAERMLELCREKDITSKDLRNTPGEPDEGVGVIEAARGTLIHHYKLDESGLVRLANMIVPTTSNNSGICISIKNMAKKIIKNWVVNDNLLNKVEMAFRAYDPCIACATHALPGQMPMEIEIYDHKKALYKKLRR